MVVATCYGRMPLLLLVLQHFCILMVFNFCVLHLPFRPKSRCLFCFLMSSSATKLSPGQVPRMTSDNFMCCHTKTERGDHDFYFSRPRFTDTDATFRELARGSNPQPLDQKSRALSTELPRPLQNHDQKLNFQSVDSMIELSFLTHSLVRWRQSG